MKFKFKLYEEYLEEATFSNPVQLTRHYNNHVLKPGEEFDDDDPKFPTMSLSEYYDAAEKCSLEPVDNVNVFGYVVYNENAPYNMRWRNPRVVKFKKSSDYNPDYSETVVYVPEGHGDEIMSYMMSRKTKKIKDVVGTYDEIEDIYSRFDPKTKTISTKSDLNS